jgi:uncharacterized protein
MNLNKLFVFIVLFGNAIASENYFETSFDCKAVRQNSVEHSICMNEKLAELDIIIADLYQQALNIDSNSIKQSQREWLKYTRNKCLTVECLEKAHLDREKFLGNILMNKERFNYKEKPFLKENNSKEFVGGFEFAIKNFENNAKKYNSQEDIREFERLSSYKLKQCDFIWSTIAGSINSGYGGMCTAEKQGKTLTIHACYNMAWSVDIQETDSSDNFNLIKFLERRCCGA